MLWLSPPATGPCVRRLLILSLAGLPGVLACDNASTWALAPGDDSGSGGAVAIDPGAPSADAGASPGHFDLAWEDGFDSLDLTRWELMTHSWDGNLAQFSATNATVDGGILSLALTAEPDDFAAIGGLGFGTSRSGESRCGPGTR